MVLTLAMSFAVTSSIVWCCFRPLIAANIPRIMGNRLLGSAPPDQATSVMDVGLMPVWPATVRVDAPLALVATFWTTPDWLMPSVPVYVTVRPIRLTADEL